ncbi:MAG: 2'-5' RNA ligase family protein [Nanoarchaeota archaeon]
MKYAIVYLVKGKAAKYQSTLIKKLANLSGETYIIDNPIPTHITLKYPFEVEDISIVEKKIKEFIKKIKPTSVKINGFENFDKFVAFLHFSFSKDAKKIQKNLIQLIKKDGIEPRDFDIEFKPHATLAYGNTKKTFNIIWNYLQSLEIPRFDLLLDNLTILKKPRKYWKIHKVFKI